MRVLRTPDERFTSLPDYPFAPKYQDVEGGLRMHYVDEGPRSGQAVLLLHGEPTWSYLYRKMIPPLAEAGFRAVAPDLIGFGKSDKPGAQSDYSYARHVAWLVQLIERLDLRELILFCQDWGSLIGLRAAAEHPQRVARIVVANGFLPTGQGKVPAAFKVWRAFARYSPLFPIGRIIASGCVTKLPPAVRAAYDAPFPSSAYMAGARIFPALVPVEADNVAVPDNLRAWEVLGKWQKPVLTLFGKNDPILGHADAPLQRHIPGCQGQPHERFWGGHFVQEDRGDYLAQKLIAWLS